MTPNRVIPPLAESFPLHWPTGWPRTQRRHQVRARFDSALGSSVQGILKELRLMGAAQIVISTNLPTRLDGLPYASQGAEPEDRGVAVYWAIWKQNATNLGGRFETKVIACDRWDRVRDNVHAVELSIQALRGLERWGASSVVERAFQGFTALPPAGGTSDERRKGLPFSVCDILLVKSDATLDECEIAYRARAKERHPDANGTHDEMTRLNAAIEHARTILNPHQENDQ